MREYSPGQVPQNIESLATFLQEELQKLTDTLSQPKFLAPTLLNSWVNFGSGFAGAGFYKDGLGRVHLKGLVKSGTISSTIFNLPKGYRPSEHLLFPILQYENTVQERLGRITILSTGEVNHADAVGVTDANAYVNLNGISFAAV